MAELINLEVQGKPFAAAVDFLRQKVNLPTAGWQDLMAGMHARGFVVAGAMKSELLADFHGAINAAIADGMTLAEFRQVFDQIVSRHGWSYRGSRGWRTAVIYNTNIQTAYQVGRFQQLDRLKSTAPYWEYRSKRDGRVREQHRQWNGLILPADDPWWDTHYPPNGWGCRCRVWPRTKRDLERAGKAGPDSPPDDGTRPWLDQQTGEVRQIPNGIDPGWDYHPGKAALGEQQAQEKMAAWQAQMKAGRESEWETLEPFRGFESYGRPAKIPADTPQAAFGPRAKDQSEMLALVKDALGADEKVFRFVDRDFPSHSHSVNVNAQALAEHLPLWRSDAVPLLAETITDPYEIWMVFERHKLTGQVALRQRFIKVVQAEGKEAPLYFVAHARDGMLEGWTFFEPGKLDYLNKQREGRLIWARHERQAPQ